MHILLTDLLTCPRCGPDFGLIVLSDRLVERHVLEGSLGCANCRSMYPIHEGVADLFSPGQAGLEAGAVMTPDLDRPVRLAALLGVTRPNANVLVLDPSGVVAAAVSPLVPEVHLIGGSIGSPAVEDQPAPGFVSRVRLGGGLPFRSGSMAGVAAVGVDVRKALGEVRRVLRPDGRLVVEGASDDLGEVLGAEGFEVHLEQDGVVVASPPGRS